MIQSAIMPVALYGCELQPPIKENVTTCAGEYPLAYTKVIVGAVDLQLISLLFCRAIRLMLPRRQYITHYKRFGVS